MGRIGRSGKRLDQTTDNAKRLLRVVDPTLFRIKEGQRIVAAKAASVSGRLSADFMWAYWYELPQDAVALIALASMGSLEECVTAVRASDPQAAVLAWIERELETDDVSEWAGGAGGMFTHEDVLSLMMAMFRSAESLVLYGAYMSELVEQVRRGSEEAFLRAIKVDRTVIFCPSVTQYAATWLSKAQLLGKKQAIRKFIAAVKEEPPQTLRKHRKLRFTLQYMKETGLLRGQVSQEGIAFLQELGVYSSSPGADRSLAQFVRRWLAEKQPVTQEPQNNVGDSPKV